MSCTKEISKGYQVTNPTGARTNVVIDPDHKYTNITVFNETDQDVTIEYKDQNSNVSTFIVPKNGRAFTRAIHGYLLSNSLFQTTAAAATGKLTINLGN